MARFAKRVLSIEPSATVRISDLITDLKARGEKILSLAIGEPDFPTPTHIIDAAKKALDDGFTKYTPAPRARRGHGGVRSLRGRRLRGDHAADAPLDDQFALESRGFRLFPRRDQGSLIS